MPNRYSQMQKPLTINPLSVEQLSLVPLAKEQAKASGVGALNRIETEYNVDAKDLNQVSGMIKDIDTQKDNLVEQIATQGINNQTINDILKLRKVRNSAYKDVINKAEENKVAIDKWENVVDKMAIQYGADYAGRVKQRGYEDWKGTMQEGAPTDFNAYYGPGYIDMNKDIISTFKNAGITSTEALSKVRIDTDPVTKQIRVTNATKTKLTSNEQNLQAALNTLSKDYSTSGTKRNEFKEFMGVSDDVLATKFEEYKNMMLRETKSVSGGGVSLHGYAPQEETPPPPGGDYMLEPMQSLNIRLPSKASSGSNTFFGTGIEYVKGFTKELTSGNTASSGNVHADFGRNIWNSIKTGFSSAEDYNTRDILSMKKSVLGDYDMSGMLLYMVDNGMMSKDLYKKANEGDKNAGDEMYELAYDYTEGLRNPSVIGKLFTGHVNQSVFQSAIKGQNLDATGKLLGNSLRGNSGIKVYDYITKEEIKEDKRNELGIQLNLSKDGAKLKGIILPGSPANKKDMGKSGYEPLPNLYQAYLMVDKDGKEYLIENRPTEGSRGEYDRGVRFEKYISDIGVGELKPVKIIPNSPLGNTTPLNVYLIADFRSVDDGGTPGGYIMKRNGKIEDANHLIPYMDVPGKQQPQQTEEFTGNNFNAESFKVNKHMNLGAFKSNANPFGL